MDFISLDVGTYSSVERRIYRIEFIIHIEFYYFVSVKCEVRNMSEGKEDMNTFCASCGIAGGDDTKLKKCTACCLVRYCSVKCQKDHRPKHKKECKKRAAELKDEILFKQPEGNHWGDCPICCLPLPFDDQNSALYPCCSKRICRGCNFAKIKREIEGNLVQKCPFCRKATPNTDEEADGQRMKRIEANNPVAICQMGAIKCAEGDYESAFEHYSRAAALGDVMAHFQLSCLYREGKGVEKDEKRSLHHVEQAAIGGHPSARCNLGNVEMRKGQFGRAGKHYIIAAKLGVNRSLEAVKDLCKSGHVSKEDFESALRGYQAAIDATKSPQREEALAFAKWAAESGSGAL